MKLYDLKVSVVHHYAYQPHNCTEAVATRIFWDEENMRIAVELHYTNGAIDFIPLEELGKKGYYEVLNA